MMDDSERGKTLCYFCGVDFEAARCDVVLVTLKSGGAVLICATCAKDKTKVS